MDESNIKDLYDMRQSGELSRESYWTGVKCFLEKLAEFASIQNDFENRLSLQNGKVIVNIKATQTHNCRVLMVLDENDVRSVPFSVLADGFYEPFQSDIFLELGKNSERFFDIGANMGFYSLALAIENPSLSVVSFEPQPDVFQRMLENIGLNHLDDQIKLINMGLGQQSDQLTMYIPRFTGTGGGSFKNLHDDEGEAIQIKVLVDSLDSLELGGPDLIKIDVEGFELNVISGASNLISENRPTIMAELLRKWMKPFGHSPQMFMDMLRDFDYRCFAINRNSLIEVDKIDEETIETNFIFVHQNRSEHLNIVLKYVDKR
jgi:FkbM family methyltransferase